MKTSYIKILLSIVACMLVLGTELQAQKSSSNSMQFNYEESKSHFFQMVKRPSLIIAPKVGLIFNESGYLAEFGLVSARTIPNKTFGFSFSYISATTTDEDSYITILDFAPNRVLETTSEQETKRFGLRASLMIPMSSTWFLTFGGGANMLTTETRITQRYYDYQGGLYNSERLLLEQSSLSLIEHSWNQWHP